MVISQSALDCLHVTVAQSTVRATGATSRLRRLWLRPADTRSSPRPRTAHATLPDLPDHPLPSASLRTTAVDA